MGNLFYYPLAVKHHLYMQVQDQEIEKRVRHYPKKKLEEIQVSFMENLRSIRNTELKDRKHFETTNEVYAKKFPLWDSDDIGDLKCQFTVFDITNNGVVDLMEFRRVLTDLGDNSSRKERIELFRRIDVGMSNLIDFNEFLTYFYSIMNEDVDALDDPTIFSSAVIRGAQQVKNIRKMSLYEQTLCHYF